MTEAPSRSGINLIVIKNEWEIISDRLLELHHAKGQRLKSIGGATHILHTCYIYPKHALYCSYAISFLHNLHYIITNKDNKVFLILLVAKGNALLHYITPFCVFTQIVDLCY